MYCHHCAYEWDEEETTDDAFVPVTLCPRCGASIHRIPTLSHSGFLYSEADNEEDEAEIKRMLIHRRIIQFIIWLIVISFIVWFMLRLFSGVPQIGMPDFNEGEYF